jgi:PAS domain S-box-containing protein
VDEADRVLFLNEAAERIHGYSAGEVLGRSVRDVFIPADKEAELRYLDALKPGDPEEIVQGLRTERLHKSGKRIPVSLTSFKVLDESTGNQRRVVIFQDMTREVEMQKRLVEQSNMAAIGEMAANMAHEIRNPLFAISSTAQVLAREPDATGETRELADSMFGEIVRLNQLLEQMLLYAKPARIDRTATNPKTLFGELVEFHRADAEEKSLRLKTDFAPPEGSVPVDPLQMKQVLRNLYLNAVQASPPGGTVEIQSRIEPDAGKWLFKITNGGEPIDPVTMSSIFKPFFSTKREGVGLGLSICRKIVEAHGGNIQCKSGPGERITFEFEIPLRAALTNTNGSK